MVGKIFSRRARRLGTGLAIGLLALEAFARWGLGFGDPVLARLDPGYEYIPRPGRYSRFGNGVEINSLGLRMPELPPTRPPGVRRILLFGDSVIYGNHFLDQAQTVPARLESALDAKGGCRTRVVPIAASSWGPVNQAAYLARHGTFGADAALIVVSGHDLTDIPSFGGRVVPYRLKASRTALGDGVRAVLERKAPWMAPPAHAMPPGDRAAASLDALDAMLSRMRAAGMRVGLVYHPTLPEWAAGLSPAASPFRAWAQARGVGFHDLRATMTAPAAGAYRDDIHPAPEGAQQMAAALADIVEQGAGPCR